VVPQLHAPGKTASVNTNTAFDIFLVAAPGLEAALCSEAQRAGFADARLVEGGVELKGGWPEIWRANLSLRGATRVLVRIAQFRAMHLAQLDKRARKVAWGDFLRPDQPVAIEATCRKSKIYHAGAVTQRVATAIREELGAPIAEKADVTVMARIEDDLVTISIDTSGEALYRRGHKLEVNRAPMRETMAALFLYQCGYRGTEPMLDPMCGSGTFVIEAAEIAAGLLPGRDRGFGFEHLAGFAPGQWQAMRKPAAPSSTDLRFFGSDIDAEAITISGSNAERAGVASLARFDVRDVGDLVRPDGPPGLVICNPPYGARLGDKSDLRSVHARLGAALKARFSGWRVGLITTDRTLAEATRLPFRPPGEPVLHGGLRVRLWQTEALK
jgi:putative N6-adenine-specific DNA methylase